MQKLKWSTLLTLLVVLLIALPVSASTTNYPNLIALPTGFQPEGITVGQGSTFYTGSLANGAIYRGDLRTGEGDVFIPGAAGQVSVGMKYDESSHDLFVAGGPTGQARVFDAGTGDVLATYQLASAGNFINDVVLTNDAAYFTNSSQPVLYKLPLGANGELPAASDVQALNLSGDWQQVSGFNANGIEATAGGQWLIVVNSTTGNLYRVDPATGEARLIDLGGQSVSAGDGLLLRGSLLYVVRNQLNQVVVVDLNNDVTAGTVVDTLTNNNLNVPTTLAAFGDALYTVNAKFGIANPSASPFEVVRVELP